MMVLSQTAALVTWTHFCRATLCIARPMMSCGACLCGRLSRSCTVSKRVKIFSNFSLCARAIILVFRYQTLWQYSDGDPLKEASNAGGAWINHDFRSISRFISETIHDIGLAIDTMEFDATNRMVSFLMTLSDVSRLRHSWTLNNWKVVTNRAVLTVADQYDVYDLSHCAIFSNIEWPLNQIV